MSSAAAFEPEKYDSSIRKTLPFYEEFYKQVVDILKVSEKKNLLWLDAGCGTGKMYEAAQEELSIQEFVFADISENMLDIARNRFQKEGKYFKKMAVQELNDHERYDVITAIQIHHYLTQREREESVKKCWNALKPGGFFFSFENFAPNSEFGKKLFMQRWKEYQLQNGISMEEADRHIMRYGKDYFPITVEQHLTLMKKCGFQIVEMIWISYMQAGFMGVKEGV